MVVIGHIHSWPMFCEPRYVYAFKCVLFIFLNIMHIFLMKEYCSQGSPQCRKCRLPDRMNSKKNKKTFQFVFNFFFQFRFVVSFHLRFKDG